MQVLGRVVGHVGDRLTLMGLFYNTNATLIGNRLQNTGSGLPWNVQEWTVSG